MTWLCERRSLMRTKLVTVALALVGCAVAVGFLGRLNADDKDSGPDKEGFVPLFGVPTWTIHKGESNTWAFSGTSVRDQSTLGPGRVGSSATRPSRDPPRDSSAIRVCRQT